MLPTHSGNRNNKGLNGIGTVNWIVVGSICWVVTSIVVIILGNINITITESSILL